MALGVGQYTGYTRPLFFLFFLLLISLFPLVFLRILLSHFRLRTQYSVGPSTLNSYDAETAATQEA
ncbi:hypothetical protein SODALDRAFT_108805 [Sodiomyces alkalinus F11]|uniref:Uncharacterized protein n=1 Tax=Sodiomyces alkalinus (strain CBS 110278 / VKM F-3762 / F11) TaxID=1314773 RepID=A0A3N2Q2H5_SODAK|nr:hypothetical protein SODALDRAFT_108805 [Sodiomyces alkalinus F11]ROT40969.1 hypothetical protein SODALDRAFT_108805 [Sodiomyces alkalinus F11]